MSASAFITVGALLLGGALMLTLLVHRAVSRGRAAATPVADDRADRMRNLLLSRMSHDLRSPLNSVITLSQLLLEGSAGALVLEQRRYVEVIHRSGRGLLSLINDVLDLAAVEAGRVELDVGAVSLAKLIHAVSDANADAARAKAVPIKVTAPPANVVVMADADRLREVLNRLVEHAIAETQAGPVVLDGEVDRDGRHAVVQVQATGEGLATGSRDALAAAAESDFDRYLSDDSAAGHGPAALPLVVAARLADVMGIRIAVRTTSNDGVVFSMALPIGDSTAVVEPAPSSAPEGATARASGSILLIEDDFAEQQRVGHMIETAGYDVTLAPSGEAGLALLRQNHFDAVVLDLVMPGMSGLDVLRATRGDERLASLSFVVMSALYMTKSERQVLGPAVTDVVRKGDASQGELAVALGHAVDATRGGGARLSHRHGNGNGDTGPHHS
jgi:signal transduction histidine kinase/CheY-like chemotaxis protein